MPEKALACILFFFSNSIPSALITSSDPQEILPVTTVDLQRAPAIPQLDALTQRWIFIFYHIPVAAPFLSPLYFCFLQACLVSVSFSHNALALASSV
jgi:hypothetical protein